MSYTPTLLTVRNMTTELPEEQYHSLKETYKLLCHLIDPKKTKVSSEVRNMARHCLKYYPVRAKLEQLNITVDFFNPR